jgi:hypothetical protein
MALWLFRVLRDCLILGKQYEIKKENENISTITTNSSRQHIMEKNQKADSFTP